MFSKLKELVKREGKDSIIDPISHLSNHINNHIQPIHNQINNLNNLFYNIHNNMSSLSKESYENKSFLKNLQLIHNTNKELTNKDLEHVKSWISHLKQSQNKNTLAQSELKQDIQKVEALLKEYIHQQNSHMIELIKLNSKLENVNKLSLFQKNELETLKNSVLTPKKPRITEKLEKSEPEEAKESSSPAKLTLTNPEKWLVNWLFSQSQPLTYQQISEKTEKTTNTLRVYINSLKKLDLIDETTLPNGSKVFALKNKQKVKTLYAL